MTLQLLRDRGYDNTRVFASARSAGKEVNGWTVEEATPEAYTADCAIKMMDRMAKGTQPWHLEVHWVEPHDAYVPLKKYLDRYDPRSIPVPASFHDSFANKPGLHRREAGTWAGATEEDVRVSRAHYYAYTEQLDAQIGRVLDALDKRRQGGISRYSRPLAAKWNTINANTLRCEPRSMRSKISITPSCQNWGMLPPSANRR